MPYHVHIRPDEDPGWWISVSDGVGVGVTQAESLERLRERVRERVREALDAWLDSDEQAMAAEIVEHIEGG